MSIKINKRKHAKSSLYDSNDKFLGMVNDIEIFDIQTQIVEQGLTGYYIMTDGVRSDIDELGQITPYPEAYMITGKLFALLHKARVNKLNKKKEAVQTDREKALAWWESILGILQRAAFLKYYSPFERNENSLTGREIENMWIKEGCPIPVVK